MFVWQIKVGDIMWKLDRCGTYESREIINAAENLGYTDIEENDDTIEATAPDGFRVIIAEQ